MKQTQEIEQPLNSRSSDRTGFRGEVATLRERKKLEYATDN